MKGGNKKMSRVKIFSGSSHPALVKKICQQLHVSLGSLTIQEYNNGCFEAILKENVCGCPVFLIQTSLPDIHKLHRHLWELCQMVDAAWKSGAKETIVVMPYNSYARSDKIHTPGMALSAELLVKLLEASGMKKFIGVDLHSKEFEKFFSKKIQVYHLSALPLTARYLKERESENTIVLPADQGATDSARYLAEYLSIPMGRVEKERISDMKVKIKKINGEISGKNVIVVDDEISTGTTIKILGRKLEQMKAQSLTVALTHGLFIKRAVEDLQKLRILKEIIVTDTVPIFPKTKKILPLKVLSVAGILARTIAKISSAY